MEDVFDAAWREHPASHDTPVDTTLASLIDIRGLGVLDDPKALRDALLRACPDAPRHVAAVIAALNADVPARLVAARDDATLPVLLRASAQRLQQQAGLDAEWAAWAIRTWAHAFALPTVGLAEAGSETSAPPVPSQRPRPPAVSPAAGTIGALWDHAPEQPAATRPAMRASDVVAPIEPVEPGPVQRSEPAAIVVEPLPPEAPIAHDLPITAPAAWAPPAAPAPRRRSLAGPISMAVVVVVLAAVAWFALEGTPWSKRPVPATASTTAPADSAPAPVVTVTPPVMPAVEPAPTIVPDSAPTIVPEPAPSPPSTVASAGAEAPTSTPALSRRPAIARVDVPSIAEGAPFAIAVRLAGSARDVAAIERRVVDSAGPWPKMATALQAAGLQRSGEHTLQIPFRAMDAPARATVEFTAIGIDGTRSVAKRVVIAVAEPVAGAADPASTACTRSTCGSVVEAREIEPDVGARGALYQLTVRLDDRQIVTTTAPYRLQVGSRVRMAGTRFVPADLERP